MSQKEEVLVLIGSLRKESYNRKIFNFYKKMAGEQATFVEGKQDDFPLYNDDIRERAVPSAVTTLAEQIRKANAVLFISPEYNYSLPGVLKNTIDWLSKLPNQPFAGKPVSIISASPGKMGGSRMQYHLRQVGVFMDMRFLNRPEVMIAEVHKKVSAEGELIDENTQKHLRTHLDQFLQFIKKTN